MKKIWEILLNGGIGNQKFATIKSYIAEDNRRSLISYTTIIFIGMLVLTALSIFEPIYRSSVPSYIVAMSVSILLFLLAYFPGKNNYLLVYFCQYLLIFALLGFGIYLGTVVEPNQASTSFAILMFAAPLLFTDRPIRIDGSIIIGIVVYLLIARSKQSQAMFDFNVSVVLPYGFANLFISAMVARVKIERFALAEENRILSETDRLTGLYNRRCYEQKIELLKQQKYNEGILICAFDVNGLKAINDQLGHRAGDELLRAAATCIENSFGKYGVCYRAGGDEFMAVITGACPLINELEADLLKRTLAYKGELINNFSISVGICEVGEDNDVDKAALLADNRMYHNKKAYYSHQ